jgi:hypothetical protein
LEEVEVVEVEAVVPAAPTHMAAVAAQAVQLYWQHSMCVKWACALVQHY